MHEDQLDALALLKQLGGGPVAAARNLNEDETPRIAPARDMRPARPAPPTPAQDALSRLRMNPRQGPSSMSAAQPSVIEQLLMALGVSKGR